MDKKTGRKASKRKLWLLCGLGVVFVVAGFLVWLLISAVTTRSELELNVSYSLPEFESLESLPEFSYGDYAVAIDGEVVHKSEEVKVLPTASTAKMILGLMIMEKKPFGKGEKGETITITPEMYDRYVWYVNNGGSNSKVAVGEEISEYDALMSVFLVSSNNMADSLAIWAFGSLDGYRGRANAKLAEWGFSDTTVGVDASGFNEGTTSTASDLAKLGRKVLENEVLREIVGTEEYEVPVAGMLTNTNKILGRNRVIGVKTGYIGDVSGYCLVSGYLEGEHIVTVALLGAPTRLASFNDSLEIVVGVQNAVEEQVVVKAGETVGYYDSWWTGPVAIRAEEDLAVVGWAEAVKEVKIEMDDSWKQGALKIKIGDYEYRIAVATEEFEVEPSFGERLSHVFGWTAGSSGEGSNGSDRDTGENASTGGKEEYVTEKLEDEVPAMSSAAGRAASDNPTGNCTLKYGYLMLINPNFTVDTNYIDARRNELVSVSSLYSIREGNAYNGDNLLDAEAAVHLNEMVKAYEAEYPGHTFETRSCYRARGTTCGRLCAATGTSDHHTGLTCDLLDPAYGTALDTGTYDRHVDWQWLYANSYKYGFIDRFPAEWAGGPMSEPLNVDENGSTGLFETWHYRYVGVGPATEIATGKYNNGKYDSLEHYLKMRGMVSDLKAGRCD